MGTTFPKSLSNRRSDITTRAEKDFLQMLSGLPHFQYYFITFKKRAKNKRSQLGIRPTDDTKQLEKVKVARNI